MKRTQVLRRSELLEALGVELHELRYWLELEPLASRPTKARSATHYTPVDLLFLTVIQALDGGGLKLQTLQSFSKGLYKLLQQPAGKNDVLEIHQENGASWKLGPAPVGVEVLELRVPFAPARRRVLEYTGAHLVAGQTELNLLAPLRGVATRGRGA